MPERAKSPLVELRELEERLAVRTARIDQLQAATASPRRRDLRLARMLLFVGCLAAITTVALDPLFPTEVALGPLLAGAVGVLAITTSLCSLVVARFGGERGDADSIATRLLAACVRRSSVWQPFPLRTGSTTHPRGAVPQRAAVRQLPAIACAAAAASLWFGGVALAVTAVVAAYWLLTRIWSRQAVAPLTIQRALLVTALLGAVSIGAWAGDISSQVASSYSGAERSPADLHTRPTARSKTYTSPTSGAPSSPTYEEICGAGSPWSPTSKSAQTLLREWLSRGASLAGCAGPVRPASVDGSVLASMGRCDTELRTVGIGDRNRAILLTGQPASVVAPLVNGKKLTSVPTHLRLGSGDVYLVDTTSGTYVLARRTSTAPQQGAPARSAYTDGGCAPWSGQDYAVLLPALAHLWIASMSQNGWTWPVASAAEPDKRKSLRFVRRDASISAVGRCDNNGTCQLSSRSRGMTSRATTQLSADVLLRFAPTS